MSSLNSGKEVHTTVTTSAIDNPGKSAPVVGAGATIVTTGSTQAKTAKVTGQVPNTSVVFVNPA